MEHGADAVWAGAIRLAPPDKEQFFEFLGAPRPGLLARDARAYGGLDAPRGYRAALAARFERVYFAQGSRKTKSPSGKLVNRAEWMSGRGPSAVSCRCR